MRRSLGRGLSQLLASEAPTGTTLPVESIVPNAGQPRRIFDPEALQELAESIRIYGILQPINVRPIGEDRYEIIAGERRWRASQIAGLTEVPVSIRAADEQEVLQMALVENIQREDIGPLECARAYKRLSDEFGLTQETIADRVGKARTSVTNTMRLLNLPKKVQDGLESGKLTEGHARALLQFGTEPQMLAVYDMIVAKGLSVRDVEAKAKQEPKIKKKQKAPSISAEIQAAERALSHALAAPVRINRNANATGKITIEFFSDDDLVRIFDALGIEGI